MSSYTSDRDRRETKILKLIYNLNSIDQVITYNIKNNTIRYIHRYELKFGSNRKILQTR